MWKFVPKFTRTFASNLSSVENKAFVGVQLFLVSKSNAVFLCNGSIPTILCQCGMYCVQSRRTHEFQKYSAARNTVRSKIVSRWVLQSRSVRNFSDGKEKSSLILWRHSKSASVKFVAVRRMSCIVSAESTARYETKHLVRRAGSRGERREASAVNVFC